MPRTRTIKPEFWSDEKLARLSRDCRLTYIGLWNLSDDYGVVKGHPSWLKAQLYPYDEDLKLLTFSKWLDEIEAACMIVGFTSNDESYYYIKHFSEHQKVDHPSKQRNPAPPEDIISHQSRDIRENSRDCRVETETETETNILSGKPNNGIPVKEIITYLNEKTGKSFLPTTKDTVRHIKARINEGYSLADFYAVIDTMTTKWRGDPKMIDYLRPQTLFGTKFESYLNVKQTNNKTDPFKD